MNIGSVSSRTADHVPILLPPVWGPSFWTTCVSKLSTHPWIMYGWGGHSGPSTFGNYQPYEVNVAMGSAVAQKPRCAAFFADFSSCFSKSAGPDRVLNTLFVNGQL